MGEFQREDYEYLGRILDHPVYVKYQNLGPNLEETKVLYEEARRNVWYRKLLQEIDQEKVYK